MKTQAYTQHFGMLLASLLLLASCGIGIRFHPSQPENWPELSSIPVEFQGKWAEGDEFTFMISRMEVFLMDGTDKYISLDSLSKMGYFLQGDSLFVQRYKPLLKYAAQGEGHWQASGKYPLPMEESVLEDGLQLVYTDQGSSYPIASLRSRGQLSIRDSSENPVAIQSFIAGERYSFYWEEAEFLGRIGDTVLEEVPDEQRIKMIHWETGTEPFAHFDTTSYQVQNNTLHIRKRALRRIFRLHYDMIVKANEEYAFFNQPVYPIGTWDLTVLRSIGPNQIQLLSSNGESKIAPKYFNVLKDSVNASGDTLFGEFASPKPEELMLYLQDEDLDWGTCTRIPM